MSRYIIATGIYPPKIGGPAQYAKNLKEALEKLGHTVIVKTYTIEDSLPTGIRHLFFFFKIIPALLHSEAAIILDQFSVGLPTVAACTVFGKKSIIRTGGDFLWESYVERKKKKVFLRTFYDSEVKNFDLKEKIIFALTRWTLQHARSIVFSTPWQRDIFIKAYGIAEAQTKIIENFYGPKKEREYKPGSMLFLAATRDLVLKNGDMLRIVFQKLQKDHPQLQLMTDQKSYPEYIEIMKSARAVILVSLGDISPNMILDSIRWNVPFICTREIGIYDRIKDAGIFVDPLNEEAITDAVRNLLTEDGYKIAQAKVASCSFVHTWNDIAGEFLSIINSL